MNLEKIDELVGRLWDAHRLACRRAPALVGLDTIYSEAAKLIVELTTGPVDASPKELS